MDFEKLVYQSVSGQKLPYHFLKPSVSEAGRNYPLVLFLHGVYDRGTDNAYQSRDVRSLFMDNENQEHYPCFVLAPQCPPDSYWANFEKTKEQRELKNESTTALALVLELIEELRQTYPLDSNRFYITGLSMGGFGTFDLILRRPQLFAAAVPICGGGIPARAKEIAHLPIWIFHGTLDEVVRVENSRTMYQALLNAGATPRYTEYPDVKHDSWVNAYQEPELLEWMFSQKKK